MMEYFKITQVCIFIYMVLMVAFSSASPFTVYWNAPSYLCSKFGIHIDVSKFGIVQNTGDIFYGDKVNIFYNPGRFPTLAADGRKQVNGGIPQKGNLTVHVTAFTAKVNKQLPQNYTGVAVLDFETYYPSFFMSPHAYQEASRLWVSAAHPNWSPERVEAEAWRTFNHTAKEFFEVLLLKGRELRPGALWGYYHYPYCHNYYPGHGHCNPEVQAHNNNTAWLIRGSTALYPSIYVTEKIGWSPRARRLQVRGRLNEAVRMIHVANTPQMPILPYFWYRYHDTAEYLRGEDVVNTLGLVRVMGLQGAVIWGGGNDMASKDQCSALKTYAETRLGPLVKYLSDLPIPSLIRLLRSRQLLHSFVTSALKKPFSTVYSQRKTLEWDD